MVAAVTSGSGVPRKSSHNTKYFNKAKVLLVCAEGWVAMHNEASKQTQVGSQWAFIPKTKRPGTSLRVACAWSHTLMQLADSEWRSWKAKNNFLEQDVTLSVYFNFKKCCHWKIWKSAKWLLCNFFKNGVCLICPFDGNDCIFYLHSSYHPAPLSLLHACSSCCPWVLGWPCILRPSVIGQRLALLHPPRLPVVSPSLWLPVPFS